MSAKKLVDSSRALIRKRCARPFLLLKLYKTFDALSARICQPLLPFPVIFCLLLFPLLSEMPAPHYPSFSQAMTHVPSASSSPPNSPPPARIPPYDKRPPSWNGLPYSTRDPILSYIDARTFEELKRKYPYDGVDTDPLAYRHSPYHPKLVGIDVNLDELQRIADENFQLEQANRPLRVKIVDKLRSMWRILTPCHRSRR